jgi:hypothetical protein
VEEDLVDLDKVQMGLADKVTQVVAVGVMAQPTRVQAVDRVS